MSSEGPVPRTRAQIVDELVNKINARREARNAQTRRPLAKEVAKLEKELVDAPLMIYLQGRKGIVNTSAVLDRLKDADEPMSAEELAVAAGYEPTSGVKARITFFLHRSEEAEAKMAGMGSRRHEVFQAKAA